MADFARISRPLRRDPAGSGRFAFAGEGLRIRAGQGDRVFAGAVRSYSPSMMIGLANFDLSGVPSG